MSHGVASTWGLSPTVNSNGTQLGALEQTIRSGAHVQSATLSITGLYDWTVEPADVLYINLLNDVKVGIASYTYNPSPSTYDTVFGKDIFNVVEKPVLVAPVAPVKSTLKKPTAPTAPTAPKAPTVVKPTPPAPLGAHPTTAQVKAYNSALASYNTKLAAYNAAQTKYAADLATYNANLAIYNTKLATYNTDLATYNAAQAQYATDKAAYDAALIAYNAALPAYKVKLAEYNKYANTQAALGYDGVPLVGSGDSLYDQSHSLLRADLPNGPGTWTDLDGPKTKTNLVITFSDANLDLLQALLAGASATTDIGFGFGPECHFYDTGITLQINTVPETSATLALLGLGILSLAGVRRFSRQSR